MACRSEGCYQTHAINTQDEMILINIEVRRSKVKVMGQANFLILGKSDIIFYEHPLLDILYMYIKTWVLEIYNRGRSIGFKSLHSA